MPQSDRETDQPWLGGRDSLFRRKLDQLRDTGHIAQMRPQDSVNRIKELERSTFLDNVEAKLHKSEPQDLEKMTLLDPATELYNQSTILRILGDEIRRGRRYKYPSVALMMAIDGIEEASQRYGRLAFDSILKGAGQFLISKVRDVDIPARFAGEVFLVLCPNTDLLGGSVLAERLRNEITQNRISDVGQNWTVTVSVGLVEFPRQAAFADEVIANAQAALQESRKRGGNAITLSNAVAAG